jgi:hypothetical protein
MTTKSSIRTDWPGPPRHRHRKATTRRPWALPGRWGIPGRIGLGVVALLAGVLALNGVIQASGSPARTANNSPGVDIASLLPPPTATPTTPAAPTAQVANADAQTQVARSSASRPASRPAAGRPTAQRSVPDAGAKSAASEGSQSASARPGTPAPARKHNNLEPGEQSGQQDNDPGPSAANEPPVDDHVDGAQQEIPKSKAKAAPSKGNCVISLGGIVKLGDC